jgi:hypothetical protein
MKFDTKMNLKKEKERDIIKLTENFFIVILLIMTGFIGFATCHFFNS